MPRDEACERLKLDPGLPILLVMGGSQGASSVNQLLFKVVPLMTGLAFQIIHLTGERDERLAVANYLREGVGHYVAPFHHAMEEVYSAADMVVSRAGAASLGELSHFGLPSVLIPYPFAADDHQTANARVFADAGAAEMFAEREISPTPFAALLSNLLTDPARREKMAAAAAKILPRNAAGNVADEVARAVAGRAS